MSDFIRKKKKKKNATDGNGKDSSQGRGHLWLAVQSSSVAPGYTMDRRWWIDSLSTHPLPGPCYNPCSSGAAVFLLCWDSSSRHRWPTYMRTCFMQKILESFDWLSLLNYPNPWKWKVHEWERAPSNCIGFRGTCLGDGSSVTALLCELQAVNNAGDVTCLKIPFPAIKEAKGSNKRHTLNFRIVKMLQPNNFSWICKHLAPLQNQAFLLGLLDIKPGGLH